MASGDPPNIGMGMMSGGGGSLWDNNFSPMTGRVITASTKCPSCGSKNTSIMAGYSGNASYRKRCKQCSYQWQSNTSDAPSLPIVGIPGDNINLPDGAVYPDYFTTDNSGPMHPLQAPPLPAPYYPETEPEPEPEEEKPHTFGKGERKLNLD